MEQLSVLLVEDEYAARERMKELIARYPDLRLVDEATTGPEAVEKVTTLRPDLLFLDVSLPQMNAFEVLSSLDVSPLPLTIFTTAYDQFALQAFDVHAVDYLVKPIEQERLTAAVEHARRRFACQETDDSALRRLVDSSLFQSSRLAIRTADRIVVVDPTEIEWIEAVGNYAKLHGPGHKILARQTMSALAERLARHGFVRIHRSAMVNASRITEIVRESKESHFVVLKSGARLRIGDRYRAVVEELFGRL